MAKRKLYITREDAAKLEELIRIGLRNNPRDQANLAVLRDELQQATIVGSDAVPPDVVTMNSTVRVTDLQDNETMELTLVFPESADPANGRISVVAPLGAALLGYRAGALVSFRTPGGQRKVRIDEVIYQPEAARGLSVA